MLFGPLYDTRSVAGRRAANNRKWSGVSTTLPRWPAASSVRTVFAGCVWATAGNARDERTSASHEDQRTRIAPSSSVISERTVRPYGPNRLRNVPYHGRIV